MLNELMLLHETLESVGVGVTLRHPYIQPLAKSSLLRVFLDENSHVHSVEIINREDAPKYWTVRDGNKNSFPQLSLNRPIRPGITTEDREQFSKQRTEARRVRFLEDLKEILPCDLRGILGAEGCWPPTNHRNKILERANIIRSSGLANEFLILCDRFLSANIVEMLVTAERLLFEKISAEPSSDSIKLAATLSFLARPEDKRRKEPSIACNLLIDCFVPDASIPAASPSSVQAVSTALSQDDSQAKYGICALTGENIPVVADIFPKANFPRIGPTFIYSRNPDTPCATRYGATGSKSMSVGQRTASLLQASAQQLTSPEREGKTWRGVAPEKPGKKGRRPPDDLLIAYIDKEPDAAIAAAFVDDEAEFEALAERTCQLIDGRPAFIPPASRLEILILRRLDKGNAKAFFRISLQIESVSEHARQWQQGCKNTPDIYLSVPPRKAGEESSMRGPGFIAPGKVVAILRRVFTHGGTKSAETAGPSIADAFRLFVSANGTNQRTTFRLLSITLSRSAQLLAGVAHARCRPLGDYQEFDRRSALDVISLLGILLLKLNHPKDRYMNELPYLLGQLLAGADILHRGYCFDQRAGSIPPSLLGNSLLSAAGKNPASALAQLLKRWKPYHGWAERTRAKRNLKAEIAKAGKDSSEGRKLLQISLGAWASVRLKEIAATISAGLDDVKRPDDVFNAKLLLGYLAGLPKAGSKEVVGEEKPQKTDADVSDEI